MNLKNLSDRDLLINTETLARKERELLSEILHHLREIERRRLFSDLGFKSLFDYSTKKLGYADDQAARRIAAMRLLKELPEIESKIADGSLTLTNLGMAQTLFRQEYKRRCESNHAAGFNKAAGFSKSQKLEILIQLENKSKREAEKLVISHSGESEKMRPERIRVINETHIEVQFVAQIELQEKLTKVKGLLAHSYPNMTTSEAIDWLWPFKNWIRHKNQFVRKNLARSEDRWNLIRSPRPHTRRRLNVASQPPHAKRFGRRPAAVAKTATPLLPYKSIICDQKRKAVVILEKISDFYVAHAIKGRRSMNSAYQK